MLTPDRRGSNSWALLGVPVLDGSVLGPNVEELKATVRKLANPDNSDALAILASYNVDEVNAERISYGECEVPVVKIDSHLRYLKRADIVRNIVTKVETRIGSYPHLNMGLTSMAARELVDRRISRDEYALLTKGLYEFLRVVNNTEPHSAVRELTIDLFINGASVSEAIATARRTLFL